MDESKRVRCDYPMSLFYIYEDEVLPDDRVSTTEDCETCDEEDCDVKYCLIQEIPDDKRKINSSRRRRN